jgi:N-acetyl-alpha-D-glucosaminyl L-malate synthase BshA
LVSQIALRIGIVCYPTIGGSGVLATSLGIELARRGHDVHFISYERPFRLPPDQPRIHFHPVDIADHELFKYPDYTLPLSVKMAEVSRDHQLDILHVHYAVPHATAAFLALSMMEAPQRPRVITTLHGTDTTLLGCHPAYGPAIRHALERSDAVTAVSAFLEGETRRLLEITRPIEVIHNFVSPTPPQRSTIETRAELGVGEPEALLIHVSNLRSIKRIDLLLKTAALIKKQAPFRLLILAGASFAPFEAEVRRLDIEDRIIVRESIHNVEEYYSAADIGLVTSDSESFCLSILEGMFYGCPTVSTRVGGIPEVIQSDSTGLLVDPGDAEALANGVRELMTDRARRLAMGRAAKRFAESHFSAQIIVPAYERLYYREVDKDR